MLDSFFATGACTAHPRTGAARLLLLSAVVTTSLAAACNGGPQPGADPAQRGGGQARQAAAVKTIVLRPTEIPDSSAYIGTLKSRRSVALNPQVEGQITDIFVKSGDFLKAGAPVMQIDPLKQEAAVNSQAAARAAQVANLQLAQNDYDRNKQLFDAGVVPRVILDQAQAGLDTAKEQLKNLDQQLSMQRVQLQYYKVVAPADGIVGDVPVRVGDRVTTSTLLTTLDRPGNLELYVNVPVERSLALKMGQRVELLDTNGAVLAESHVDFIAPQVSSDTQSILAKATFENASGTLRPSQFARARVIWGVRQGAVLPVLAVARINGQFFVWVVEPGSPAAARQKLVRLGDLIGNSYPVLDGVKPGDHIVVDGAQTLLDGAAVTETVQPAVPAA
jgi:RND family efflux transporter MFP subunit